MVGSVTGGVVVNAIGTGDVFELNFVGAVVAILAAALLILLAEKSGIATARRFLMRRLPAFVPLPRMP